MRYFMLGRRKDSRRVVWTITVSAFLGVCCYQAGAADLKPGDTVNQETWQQAKNLLPEGILHRFQDGSYQAQIVTLPATTAWGSKFNSASETNAGRFEIDASGSLVTKGTNTVPPFLYGYPFPQIDPKDPQAASKVINNFSYALMQADDVDRSSSLSWVTPTAVQNHVDFQTQLLFHGSRFSGPIDNPDITLRKGIIAGLSPAEVDGV